MDLFDLYAKITLDTGEYESGLDDASRKTSSFADTIKNGLATAAKVGAVALGAAATGIAALAKSSIDQYAEYEQLVGGVDTLFKDASDTIQEYAENAYKTAGVSANTYMEQATAFSASLIQSLGGDTQAAAEYANQAIMDMSDNANKMGTDIESIQMTYQSLMRGNYEMLDNLKLGYGGTKTELERLVADASELTGKALDPAKFSDVITAIHAVQENMGITGTTAAEAATTIQGSISMMSAAWQNFLTGMADPNQDFDALLGNLVDSVVTVGENIIPRIQALLPRLADGISQLGESLLPYIPETLQTLLPTLISGATNLINGFTAVLPQIITTAVQAIPQLASAAASIVGNLASALINAAPQILSAGAQLLDQLANGLESAIPNVVAKLPEVIQNILDYLTDNMPAILEKGVEIINSIVNGIVEAIPDLVAALPEIIASFTEFIADNLPQIISAGYDILINLITGIISAIPDLVAKLPEIVESIKDYFSNAIDTWIGIGKAILEGVGKGILSGLAAIKNTVLGVIDTVKGWFTGSDGFDTHSPSKWSIGVAEFIMQGLAIGMENSKGEVMETAEDIVNEVKDRFDSLSDALTLTQDVGGLEYELWERTLGINATDAEKYEKQLELLSKQEQSQAGIVEAAYSAYEAVAQQYGENSAESLSYQKTLLEEALAYQDLLDEINEVIAAKEKLYEQGTATVSYADSTSGRVTEAAINAVTSGTTDQEITLNANLNLPDGTKFAAWQLPFLIKAGSAAGTPIANPQMA